MGGGDGWVGEEWWVENGDNCSRTTIKKEKEKELRDKQVFVLMTILWLKSQEL